MNAAKFEPGQIVTTANILNHLTHGEILSGLLRHITGDWGDAGEDDWRANEVSLERGFRLFSIYHSPRGVKFWIITEADRSTTTVLLPED
jgi:hypothetical protein